MPEINPLVVWCCETGASWDDEAENYYCDKCDKLPIYCICNPTTTIVSIAGTTGMNLLFCIP